MSTTNSEQVTSIITDEAYELISCFYDGVDEIVYAVALDIARERNPAAAEAGEPVQIDTDDVRRAGRKVIGVLKEAFGSGVIPEEMERGVEGMEECFET